MSNPEGSRERRLQEVLVAYLEALERGAAIPDEEMLARHPDLAAELSEFLANRARLDRLGAPLRALAEAAQAQAASNRTIDAPGGGAATMDGVKVRYFGDYELLAEIAKGGMGIVYRARQTSLQRHVALKMILAGELATPAQVERFRKEAAAAARLDHAHIVPIYEVGEHDGRQYFSMKLIEGASLAHWIAHCRPQVADWPRAQRASASLIATVARAVQHAHERGILHRDLKPANILLQAPSASALCDLQAALPLVSDFGLAKQLDSGNGPTSSGALLGTPAYMAPEQAAGQVRQLGVAADVYALGAILYELLTGRPAFQGDVALEVLLQVLHTEPVPPALLEPRTARDLETICLKCLEKSPRKRYASAAELADDLDRFVRGEPIRARPVGRPERAWRWVRRNPVLSGLSAALALSLLAGLIGVTLLWFNAERLRHEAERERDQSTWRLARNYISRATDHVERGDALGALPWLVAAWPLEQNDPERAAVHALRLGLHERAMPRLLWSADRWQRPVHNPAVPVVTEVVREGTGFPGQGWAAFTPDGRQVVAVKASGQGGWLETWDVESGRPSRERTALPFVPATAILDAAGRRVAISFAVGDGKTLVWDIATGQRASPPGENGALPGVAVAFAPDGEHLLVANIQEFHMTAYRGEVRLWDWAKAKALTPPAEVRPTGNPERQDLVSPDGKLLLIAGGDGRAQLWDRATGKPLHEPWPHAGEGAAFRPDSGAVVTVSGGRAILWDVKSGKALPAAQEQPGPVRWAWFSSDGRFLVTLGQFGEVGLRDGRDGARFGEPSPPRFRLEGPAALAPDGQTIAVADGAGVHLLGSDGKPGVCLLPVTATRSLAFHPDGRRLLTLDGSGVLRLWDLAMNAAARIPCPQNVWEAAYHGAGLLAVSSNTRVAVWDERRQKLIGAARPYTLAHGYQFSGDGSALVTVHAGTIYIDDTATGRPRRPPLKVADNDLTLHCRVNREGSLIAAAASDRLILWDTITGATRPLGVEGRGAKYMAFHPDRKRLLVGDDRGDLQWHDVASGAALGAPAPLAIGAGKGERGATLLRDGRHVLLAQGREARLWDLVTERVIGPVLTGLDETLDLVLSPDARRFATAEADGSARIWDLASGAPVTPPLSHSSRVVRVHNAPELPLLVRQGPANALGVWFSPDGSLVATHNYMQTRLWDAVTGERIGPALDGKFTAFSHDGRRLLTVWSQAAFWWDVTPTQQPFDAWRRQAALLAGLHIDATGGLVPVHEEPVATATQSLQALAVLPHHRSRAAWYSAGASYGAEESLWGMNAYVVEGALWHLDRVLATSPEDAASRLERARLRVLLQRWADAVADYTGAIEAGKVDADILAARGYALGRLERWADAAADFARAGTIAGERLPPYFHGGGSVAISLAYREALARLLAGDTDGYRRLCARELAQARGDEQRRFEAARLCALAPGAADDLAEPLAWARQHAAAVAHQDQMDARLTSAGLLLHQGKPRESLASLQKLDSLLEGDARTHYRLAQAQRALGDQAAAKACLAAAAEANGWGGDSWWLTVERTLLRRQAGGS